MMGEAAIRMGHVFLPKARVCRESWWIDADRQGFTAKAAQEINVVIPVDDVSDQEVQLFTRRRDVMSLLIGLQAGKATAGVKAAYVRN